MVLIASILGPGCRDFKTLQSSRNSTEEKERGGGEAEEEEEEEEEEAEAQRERDQPLRSSRSQSEEEEEEEEEEEDVMVATKEMPLVQLKVKELEKVALKDIGAGVCPASFDWVRFIDGCIFFVLCVSSIDGCFVFLSFIHVCLVKVCCIGFLRFFGHSVLTCFFLFVVHPSCWALKIIGVKMAWVKQKV